MTGIRLLESAFAKNIARYVLGLERAKFQVKRRKCPKRLHRYNLTFTKYYLHSTPPDEKPGRCNFIYNDKVRSHLHGYVLLVGLFCSCQSQIRLSFAAFASLAAGFTLARYLPSNSCVPAPDPPDLIRHLRVPMYNRQ
jgi:hypothetical protein